LQQLLGEGAFAFWVQWVDGRAYSILHDMVTVTSIGADACFFIVVTVKAEKNLCTPCKKGID
jgi:hypothetical protein